MHLNTPSYQRPKTRGFALVIVLFGLTIIAALFISSSKTYMFRIETTSGDAELAVAFEEAKNTVQSASKHWPSATPVYTATISGKPFEIRDVSGLVDLNTASRPLLEEFFDHLGLDSAQKRAFYAWRSTGRRILRVEDLKRISGARQILEKQPLHRMATVHSGRTGVAIDAATPELLALMQWDRVPASRLSELTHTTAALYINGNSTWSFIGTFSIDLGSARVLETQ